MNQPWSDKIGYKVVDFTLNCLREDVWKLVFSVCEAFNAITGYVDLHFIHVNVYLKVNLIIKYNILLL